MNGKDVSDSQLAIEYLEKELEKSLNDHLKPEASSYSAVSLHFQLIVHLFSFSGGGRGEGVPGHAGRPLRLVPRHRQARLWTGKGEEGYKKSLSFTKHIVLEGIRHQCCWATISIYCVLRLMKL